MHNVATMSDKTIESGTLSFIVAGSFPSIANNSTANVSNSEHISPRLLRHFNILWVSQPSRASLRRVFESVMETELLNASSIKTTTANSTGTGLLSGNQQLHI
jgi:citrate synthase